MVLDIEVTVVGYMDGYFLAVFLAGMSRWRGEVINIFCNPQFDVSLLSFSFSLHFLGLSFCNQFD